MTSKKDEIKAKKDEITALKMAAKGRVISIVIALFFFLAGAYAKNYVGKEINVVQNRITKIDGETSIKFNLIASKFETILTALCIIEEKTCKINK